MPAEQEARVIANDALEHDGWLDPVDMMRLARAYLALEAELLAAQAATDEIALDARDWMERAIAAQEREKALREALETVEPLIDAQFEGHAGMGEYMVKVQKLNQALDVVRAAIAGSPSEKPGSEDNPRVPRRPYRGNWYPDAD